MTKKDVLQDEAPKIAYIDYSKYVGKPLGLVIMGMEQPIKIDCTGLNDTWIEAEGKVLIRIASIIRIEIIEDPSRIIPASSIPQSNRGKA